MQTQPTPQASVTGRLRDRVKEIGMKVILSDEAHLRSLMPDAAPERNRYRERDFRQHFLPVMSGEAAKNLAPGYTVERLNEEAHQYWATVAGGVSREVEVIDDAGEVAFIVPALADTSRLRTAQHPEIAGLKTLQEEVLQDVQGRPDVAETRMLTGLERKIAYLVSSGTGDTKRTVDRIKAMHDYYGLKYDDGKPAASISSGGGFMGEMSFD